MNITTKTYPRTARMSGTEIANSIEHYRKDRAGFKIIGGCICLVILAYGLGWMSI